MEIDKALVGNIIKKERKNIGITQEELALKLGLNNKSSVSQYEKGDALPGDDIKIKMCELFNCTMDYLIGKSKFKNIDQELESFLKEDIKEELSVKLQSIELDEKDLEKAITAFIENYMIIPDSPSVDIYNMEDSLIYYAYELITKYYFRLVDKELSIITNNSELLIDKQAYFDNAEKNAWKEMRKILKSIDKNNIVSKLTSEQKVEKLLSKLNNKSSFENIPIVGKIAAGQPILTEEYRQGVLPVDPNIYGLTTSDDLFYLLVSGDSMDRKVENGDYVLIHKQDYAQDGDIIVAIVNDDDEATLKRYKVISNQYVQLEPMSTNPIHQTRTIDLKTTKFLIIGKAIGKFGKF